MTWVLERIFVFFEVSIKLTKRCQEYYDFLILCNTYYLRSHTVDYESAKEVCFTMTEVYIFIASNAYFTHRVGRCSKFVEYC